MKVIQVGLDDDEHGNPIPIWELLPAKKLKQLRDDAAMNAYLWAANYRNDPLPPESAINFKREWFKIYEELPCALSEMRIAITVDLAVEEHVKADYTAVVVSGIAPGFPGDLYVLSATRGRWSSSRLYEELAALDAVYKPMYIGIESVSFQKLMIQIVDADARRGGKRLILRPLKPDGNKTRRAGTIHFHAERHGIYVKKEHEILVDEFDRFPAGKHDDFVDALAYRGRDLIVPGALVKAEPRLVLRKVDCTQWHHKGSDIIEKMHGGRKKRGPVFPRVRLGRGRR